MKNKHENQTLPPATSEIGADMVRVEIARDIDVPKGAWPWIEDIARQGTPPNQRIETPRDHEAIVYWQDEQPAAFVLNLRDQFNRSIQYRVDLRFLAASPSALSAAPTPQAAEPDTCGYMEWADEGEKGDA